MSTEIQFDEAELLGRLRRLAGECAAYFAVSGVAWLIVWVMTQIGDDDESAPAVRVAISSAEGWTAIGALGALVVAVSVNLGSLATELSPPRTVDPAVVQRVLCLQLLCAGLAFCAATVVWGTLISDAPEAVSTSTFITAFFGGAIVVLACNARASAPGDLLRRTLAQREVEAHRRRQDVRARWASAHVTTRAKATLAFAVLVVAMDGLLGTVGGAGVVVRLALMSVLVIAAGIVVVSAAKVRAWAWALSGSILLLSYAAARIAIVWRLVAQGSPGWSIWATVPPVLLVALLWMGFREPSRVPSRFAPLRTWCGGGLGMGRVVVSTIDRMARFFNVGETGAGLSHTARVDLVHPAR